MEGSDNGYSTSLENWSPERSLWVRLPPLPPCAGKTVMRETASEVLIPTVEISRRERILYLPLWAGKNSI